MRRDPSLAVDKGSHVSDTAVFAQGREDESPTPEEGGFQVPDSGEGAVSSEAEPSRAVVRGALSCGRSIFSHDKRLRIGVSGCRTGRTTPTTKRSSYLIASMLKCTVGFLWRLSIPGRIGIRQVVDSGRRSRTSMVFLDRHPRQERNPGDRRLFRRMSYMHRIC